MSNQKTSPEIAHKHFAQMRAALNADDFNQCIPVHIKQEILHCAKTMQKAGRSLSARKIQETRGLLNDLEAQLNTKCNKCKAGEYGR